MSDRAEARSQAALQDTAAVQVAEVADIGVGDQRVPRLAHPIGVGGALRQERDLGAWGQKAEIVLDRRGADQSGMAEAGGIQDLVNRQKRAQQKGDAKLVCLS